MRRMIIILTLAIILSGNLGLLPSDVPGYIGPPVVVRICQLFPLLCAR